MKLKYLAFIFILITGCASSQSNNDYPKNIETEDGLFCRIYNDYVVVTGIRGSGKEVIIPDYINDRPVKEIGREAFKDKKITKVRLPQYLVLIDREAFSGCSLTEIELPDNIVKIENRAFARNEIKNIILPAKLKEIGSYLFDYNPITKITITEKLDITQNLNNFLDHFIVYYMIQGQQTGTYEKIDEKWLLEGNNELVYGRVVTMGGIQLKEIDKYSPYNYRIRIQSETAIKPGSGFSVYYLPVGEHELTISYRREEKYLNTTKVYMSEKDSDFPINVENDIMYLIEGNIDMFERQGDKYTINYNIVRRTDDLIY